MRPSLKHGDMVALIKEREYLPGDIAVYKIEDAMYMHRIIRKNDNSYYFRDDSNISEGLWVNEKNVVGRLRRGIFSGRPGYYYNIIIRCIYKLGRPMKRFLKVSKITE